ncbi:MAG: GNAT family N-acetyltransferase, partial [Candidatus Methanofastidiosia archaeon]
TLLTGLCQVHWVCSGVDLMIKGEKVILRALEREDLDRCWRWINDREVTRYLRLVYPISKTQEEKWFENQMREDEHNKIFAIQTHDGKHVGNCGLHNINWKDRNSELGIMIGERDFQNKGFGTDAIRTLLKLAFSEMNLHRVHLRVYDFNERAQRCYEKCGFVKEGVLREDFFGDGRFYDTIIMGILREKWENLK